MKISEKLERKIRVLCNKFPTTEWSGQLFYTYTGSFEKGDIVFTAEDLLFMDPGCGVTTEFYLDEGNAAAYIADHELWNCQMGLIHSHHNMGAFFSGQDDAMLLQEGTTRNHFLSLVVDNKGTYVARVTIKEQYEQKLITKKTFRTYNDVASEVICPEESSTYTIVSTYDLDITNEFAVTCDDYDELMETIRKCDEIKKSRIAREKKEEKKREKKEKKKKKEKGGKPFQVPGVQTRIQFPYQPDEESQRFNQRIREDGWDDPDTYDPVPLNDDFDNLPAKILTDERIGYYVSQIISLGFLHTNANGIENFLENLDKFMQNRFKDIKKYRDAVTWMCDYLLDTELIDELSDVYPPRIVDDAFVQAKLEIAEYFSDILKRGNNPYIQIIYDYITQ